MRVLYIAGYFQPENIAFTHLENDLLTALVRAGYEIDVICPIPTRGVTEAIKKKYKSIMKEELYEGKVHVHRFRLESEHKDAIKRTFRYLKGNVVTYRKAVALKEKFDLVFAGSTPPTQGYLAAKIAKKLQIPFIYDLQDIFPDSLINAAMTKKGSIIWKIGRKIEDYTYKHADKIITISDGFKCNIAKKGVPHEKISVIPNWIDTDVVKPIPRAENKLIERYNLDPNKFYINYCGNIGLSQNFEMLVEASDRMKENQDIQFIIIGDGAYSEVLAKTINDRQLKNIILLPFQPYEDIADVFSLGDVGLIISKPGIGGSSVPSKALSIMATGRPILASFDKDSELVRMIERNKCGVWCDPSSVEGFVEKCLRLSRYRITVNTMGKNSRSMIEENFSTEKLTNKYTVLFNKVVSTSY